MNLKELMEEIPLSHDHARRLFVKVNKKTPIVYLMDKRVDYAKVLLRSYGTVGSKYIKEIAYLVLLQYIRLSDLDSL